MGEAEQHIVQHDRMSDSCEPGQWVYGSFASNISETCVAEPRDFSRREYQIYKLTHEMKREMNMSSINVNLAT